MKIAIIGGGVTGLTAAYDLTKQGHSVTVFEKEQTLGGLAYGFTKTPWSWHIEGAYHHLFTNDTAIKSLLVELGLKDDIIIKRPVTASLWNGAMYQMDSPLTLISFPGLPLVDKLRTALLLAFFKLTPVWKPLETLTAERLVRTIGGTRAFEVIWKPLLYGKFGTYAPKVSASWFWARIKKRTPSLMYIRGGFHTFITALADAIRRQGGVIHASTAVSSVLSKRTICTVTWGKKKQQFDTVLFTIPSPLAFTIAPQLFRAHPAKNHLLSIPHLWAQTLILETDKPILSRPNNPKNENVYWLNVTDTRFPFLAAVAHTNFVDKKYYGGKHLTYFGNYLPQGHPYLSMEKKQLLKTFLPHIKSLLPSPKYSFTITDSFMFVGPFAQPVHTVHYSKKIPDITTPTRAIYMANMDYVYPWDRGTNYAVELGHKAAAILCSEHPED